MAVAHQPGKIKIRAFKERFSKPACGISGVRKVAVFQNATVGSERGATAPATDFFRRLNETFMGEAADFAWSR